MTRDNRKIHVHHISYKPEITCTVFEGEHQILTLLRRMTKNPPSKCFVDQLALWFLANNNRCIDLDNTL